jgi:hypothetical protein
MPSTFRWAIRKSFASFMRDMDIVRDIIASSAPPLRRRRCLTDQRREPI